MGSHHQFSTIGGPILLQQGRNPLLNRDLGVLGLACYGGIRVTFTEQTEYLSIDGI